MGEEREERLAVRLLVQRPAAERLHIRDAFDVGREVVEALGAQEEAAGHLRRPRQPERRQERRSAGGRLAVVIAAAAFGIESAALGKGLEQRRFAAAVLPDETRDGPVERQVDALRERLHGERKSGRIDLLRPALDSPQEWGSHGGRSWHSRAPTVLAAHKCWVSSANE